VLGSAAIGSPRYQLVDDGHLTADQRVALAVEDGAATLTTHDARQITNVLHTASPTTAASPSTRSGTAAPNGFLGWLTARADPLTGLWGAKVDDPQWAAYLSTLAAAAARHARGSRLLVARIFIGLGRQAS
jgi:hypothetical protein